MTKTQKAMYITILSLLFIVVLFTFWSCTLSVNNDLRNETFIINGFNYDDASEEVVTSIYEGTYSDYVIIQSTTELDDWISVSEIYAFDSSITQGLQSYDESFFNDNILLIAIVVDRAYSRDFYIHKQLFIDHHLSLEIGYYVPWYAFGDSYPELRGIVIEFPKTEADLISVDISYVSRFQLIK